ncbi:AlpA family phage regulatory protein [Enterobacter hormaechei]|uniref:helix-turn-helix transcriptional regulator n=1 Tax=Enterobacter TaxID=547 RepID=UPI0021CDF413|nr:MULTISPECIES: AlpA family phage regulatory protein [Enterobacter]MCU6347272.1 AlpA family phage regulatory protein [Enterobacter quasiroggenkampii]MDH0671580.1 AlpA family phage regulatory protein [Enterobacter hormaechei]MDH0715736.1 AlpA family phage regulatory protein [Enterobacter hormaechei]
MNTQPTRLIRSLVVTERTGYGRAWIYHPIIDGLFPAPVKIGVFAVTFVERESEEWILLIS